MAPKGNSLLKNTSYDIQTIKIGAPVFGRPFVKWFTLCYQTIVCLSVCPACLWRWCTAAKQLDGSRWNSACR